MPFQPSVLSLIACMTMSDVMRPADWLCPITSEALQSLLITRAVPSEAFRIASMAASSKTGSVQPAFFSFQVITPISNGGLILTPPGYFTGSARGGISQYHFYRLPPKGGISTFFRPLTYHFLLVLEYILILFLRLHCLLLIHNTL